MKKPLQDHQERKNKKDGKEVAKHSDSAIDENLTEMNVSFLQDEDRFRGIRKKLDTINEKRKENGQRKLRKDANIMMAGTLQISDDSLESLGWLFDEEGYKLAADKQPPQAVENVKIVYRDMLQSIKAQPEVYGDVFSATLHFDETSPHVDFMSDVIDENELNQTARDFLNGRTAKETGGKSINRGEKLRVMQENLMLHSKLSKETIGKHDLVRGDSNKEKVNKIKTIKKDEKNVKEQTDKVLKANEQLHKDYAGVQELSQKAAQELAEVKEQKSLVNIREQKVNVREVNAGVKERDLNKREKIAERLQSFYVKVSELIKGVDTSAKAFRKFKKVQEVQKKYEPLTDDNVESYLDEMDTLDIDDGAPNTPILTDEDLKGIESKDDGMSL